MADEKRAPHVEAAYNELEFGVRTGAEDAVTRGRKRLDAAGEDGVAAVAEARERHAAAAERRAAAASSKPNARTTPPQGRTAPAKATTDAKQQKS